MPQSLIFLALMMVAFYFLLIRPQQRRMRQQRSLMASLAVGDEVVTLGGMYGVIRAIDDEEVTLEIAEGIDARFLRSAISRKVSYDEGPYENESEEEEEEAGEQS